MGDELTCPKCSQAMARGFIPEFSSHSTSLMSWVQGEPQYSFWAAGVKIDPDQMIRVVTYRCVGCGFLESYARQEAAEGTGERG